MGNDLGGALYAISAYEIFGINASALYNFFFLMLALTMLAFVLAYYRDPVKLFALLCVVLAIYALAKPFSMGGIQLGAFHALSIGVGTGL